MPNFGLTDFSQRRGSPFKDKSDYADTDESVRENIEHFEVTSNVEKNKQIRSELLGKANKMSAEIASNKPNACDGFFTEVTTCGAFTVPKTATGNTEVRKSPPTQSSIPKSQLGFPSSANTIALDAKAVLESDPNISNGVKETVISKLFILATMVQNIYESKVRIVSEFEKYKEKHLRDEVRREREQSEQLYKINMSFQSEVVQTIQQLKMDLGAARGNTRHFEPDDPHVKVERNKDADKVENKNVDQIPVKYEIEHAIANEMSLTDKDKIEQAIITDDHTEV